MHSEIELENAARERNGNDLLVALAGFKFSPVRKQSPKHEGLRFDPGRPLTQEDAKKILELGS